MATLITETNNYLFYSLKYGCVLLDKNFEIDAQDNSKIYNNVFFQGDDHVEIFESVESLINQKVKIDYLDHFFSNYDDVMSKSKENDLERIGILIASEKEIKNKI